MKKPSKKINEKELNFLKAELKRTDDQIGHYKYGGNIEKIKRIEKLWELRRDIMGQKKITRYCKG